MSREQLSAALKAVVAILLIICVGGILYCFIVYVSFYIAISILISIALVGLFIQFYEEFKK